jgi:hypothetical protein
MSDLPGIDEYLTREETDFGEEFYATPRTPAQEKEEMEYDTDMERYEAIESKITRELNLSNRRAVEDIHRAFRALAQQHPAMVTVRLEELTDIFNAFDEVWTELSSVVDLLELEKYDGQVRTDLAGETVRSQEPTLDKLSRQLHQARS